MGYPIAVSLTGRIVLVVGGGSVAARRVRGLLGHGAAIRVVAPEISPDVRGLGGESISYFEREYEPDDTAGAFLVIAATNRPEVNARAAADGLAHGALVCCTSDPALGNFTTPAVIDRGDLTITVSTDGGSPTLAAVLKERLEEEFGPEWVLWPQLLTKLRETIQALPTPRRRRDAVRAILASPSVRTHIQLGEIDAAEAAARTCI